MSEMVRVIHEECIMFLSMRHVSAEKLATRQKQASCQQGLQAHIMHATNERLMQMPQILSRPDGPPSRDGELCSDAMLRLFPLFAMPRNSWAMFPRSNIWLATCAATDHQAPAKIMPTAQARSIWSCQRAWKRLSTRNRSTNRGTAQT